MMTLGAQARARFTQPTRARVLDNTTCQDDTLRHRHCRFAAPLARARRC